MTAATFLVLCACTSAPPPKPASSSSAPGVGKGYSRDPYPSTYHPYPGVTTLVKNVTVFDGEGGRIDLQGSPRTGGGVVLSVRDQGVGISVEDQQHLFSSFFRGANATNIEGTGLGLHIVRRYLGLLQGKIRLESAPDEGTTVTLELPSLVDESQVKA